MVNQFFINGIEIILPPNVVIAVTYQANNIGELQKRQGVYTNTFDVPVIDENAQALEHSNLMTSASLYPYKILTGTLIQDGIEVFTDGQVRIVSIENGIAKVNIIAGNVDLSKAIGDLIVGELFADDTVYPWTLQNVFDSRDKSRYYIYPVIDWRTDIDTMFSSPFINVRELLPCALMTAIFERLENYTGYTFTGNYIESDAHKNMILTPSDFSRNPEYNEDEETKAEGLTYFNSLDSVLIPEGGGTITQSFDPLFIINEPPFFNGSYYPPVNEVGSLKVNYIGSIRWNNTEQYGQFESPQSRSFYFVTRIKKGGVVVAEITSEVQNVELSLASVSISSIVNTGEIILEAGQQYFVQFEFFIEQHSNINSEFEFFQTYIKFTHSPSISLVYGNDIRFRDLFRMKVKDVFYDILNLRGLIIQTNSYTKEVQFNEFNDLIKNKSIAKDWSSKIDIRTSVLSFKFGKYSQRNNLLFKDNSEVTQGLGNYYFDVNDENLEAESNAVQIKHPATEETNKYLGANIPKIEGIDNLNKWEKPEHRILQLTNQSTQYDVEFEDGTSALITTTNIPFCNFIGFDELVPQYYNALTGILENTKALGLVFNLTPLDIQELDFSIPVFLNVPEMDINGYFYINKISNYSRGLTSCELIRL